MPPFPACESTAGLKPRRQPRQTRIQIAALLYAPALAAISCKLEGKTERQNNPHARGTLAFVSCICARLGGWNCSYKKPGPKTMNTGWNALAQEVMGYAIAKGYEMCESSRPEGGRTARTAKICHLQSFSGQMCCFREKPDW